METIVTSVQMQECDRFAIERLKIPGLILMENAGRSVADAIERHLGEVSGKTVLIFCGKGNNGGDGYVLARHILMRGAVVTIILTCKPKDLKGDALVNYEGIRKYYVEFKDKSLLRILELKTNRSLKMLPKPEIIVDALFGTGFSGEVRGIYQDIIAWINKAPGYKVSIDVPSGLNASTGEVVNLAVRADLTPTMGLIKTGLIIGKGRSYCGTIEVVNMGAPLGQIYQTKSQTFLIQESDISKLLPSRPIDAHKHSVGKIFVLAGSRGLTGAAAMVSASAMMAGAGAVILGTPRSVYPILAKKLTEVMVEPLAETADGTLSLEAWGEIAKHVKWADILIIGPGISRNASTRDLILKLLENSDKPMVIDADGLNVLEKGFSALKKRKSREIIITPHTGEFSRLTKKESSEIERNRLDEARKFAKEFKLTLVLKGAPTITASENGDAFINSTGNPGMATAGSGDVLAGIIGGLWAQGMRRTDAACSGVYLHGLSGDLARKIFGEKSLMALDIQHFIPDSIRCLEKSCKTLTHV